MKKVFSNNNQLAHVYAQQSQNEGWTSSRSMFFKGAAIYSYGHHFMMAVIKGNTCIYNSDSYSVSTSKQQGIVRSATNHYKAFFLPNTRMMERAKEIIEGENSGYDKQYIKNMKDEATSYIKKAISDGVKYSAKKRTKNAKNNKLLEFVAPCSDIIKTCSMLGVTINKPLRDKVQAIMHDGLKVMQKELAIKEKAEKKRKAELAKIYTIAKEKFINGESLEGQENAALRNGDVVLHFNSEKDIVTTSHGASFPAKDAKLFYKILPKIAGQNLPSYGENSVKLGYFAVNKVHKNKDVKAGCHFVKFNAIHDCAVRMGIV